VLVHAIAIRDDIGRRVSELIDELRQPPSA
jgi:hypothetical protein